MFKLLDIDLHMFDGGAAGGGASAGGDGAGDGGNAAGSQALPDLSRRGKKTGDSGPKVVYGKQDTEAATQTQAAAETAPAQDKPPEKTPEERKAEFDAFIKGDYKDIFAERTQQIIDRRFKETRGLQEQLEAVNPVLEMLASKYDIEGTDPKAIREAIERDEEMWINKADKAGMTVDQFKTVEKMKRENEALRRDQERRLGMEQAQRQYNDWIQQAEAAKATYPNLDLRAELAADPQFGQMLKVGIPVQKAYEVLHMDSLKASVAQGAASLTEKRVTDNIRAKGERPAENGAAAKNNGVIIKSDPSQLTKADRAEIARRVQRGETISF